MTRNPRTRAASFPAARGSAVPDADPAGISPSPEVPAQTSASPAPQLPGDADPLPCPPHPSGASGEPPGPETRSGPAVHGTGQVRARGETPAGGASPAAEHSADASPDRTTGYSGEEFRKRARAVLSDQAKEQRRRATRPFPKARKGVQAASGPGMVRRMPPPQTPGDAA